MNTYPTFANTGDGTAPGTVQWQEAAAFLAHVFHETGGLQYAVEQDTANYPNYCDSSKSYGCPAGTAAYYGRGSLQLSWNFNYQAASDPLGFNLLNEPGLVVANDPGLVFALAWRTGLWYWMTQPEAGSASHDAMVSGAGFGETIRIINSIECGGGNPGAVNDRVSHYRAFAGILGVDPGPESSWYC